MRERLFSLVQKAQPGDRISKFYDTFITVVAFVSVAPLMVKGSYPILDTIDLVTVYILFADYIFRWVTHDYKSGHKNGWAFVRYPFTPYALVMLVSLLPSLGLVSHGFRVLRLFRITVVFQYSNNFRHIARVFQKERKTLMSVLYIAVFYIFLSALVMFAYEPDNFENFFEATYWATTALTTVGYGDVYPVSTMGKIISMISSLFGIAVIALPAGIVTAGFVDEINKEGKDWGEEAEAVPETGAVTVHSPLLRATPRIRRYACVMVAGFALNIVLRFVAQRLNLPLWLDVTGTAFAAMALEPAAGLLVGLGTNMVLALMGHGPGAILYYSGSAAVAVVAGAYLVKDGKIVPGRILPAALMAIVVSAVVTGGVDYWLTGGSVPDSIWEYRYYSLASSAGVPHALAYLLGHLVVKTYDILATGAIAVGLNFLYKRWVAKAG